MGGSVSVAAARASRRLWSTGPAASAAGAWSPRRAARDGALEDDTVMTHPLHPRGHVENESAVADVDITRHFVRHPIVASHEKRTDRFVVLERPQPVRVLLSRLGFPELGELPVPGRIRHLHRELVGELALAVFRVPGAGNRPGLR